MAAVSNRKWKKRGREKRNSARVTIKVTQRIVSFFSRSRKIKRPTPRRGKKVMRLKRGNADGFMKNSLGSDPQSFGARAIPESAALALIEETRNIRP
jgi:hypothetical protein